jgi:hypothetical protein
MKRSRNSYSCPMPRWARRLLRVDGDAGSAVAVSSRVMAAARRDLLGRLSDLSEEAIQRLGDVPGGDRVFRAFSSLRDQLAELQKRVTGLEDLERRLTALEKKVDRLSRTSGGRAAAATRRTTSAGARPSAKKS